MKLLTRTTSYKNNLVPNKSQLLDLNLNDISMLQEYLRIHKHTNSTRRAHHDRRPSPQRPPTTQVLHSLHHAPDHVIRIRLLPYFSVHFRCILQLLRIAHYMRSRHVRSNRREVVWRLRIPGLSAADGGWELEVAGREIVAAAEAQYVVEGIGSRDVLGIAADDGSQFTFVVDLLLQRWVHVDVVERSCDAVGWFGEDDWVGGDCHLDVNQS